MSCLKPSRWNDRLRIVLMCMAGLLALPAAAQVTSVIFERTTVRIEPFIPAAVRDDTTPVEVRQALAFDVEVRSEEAAKLEYIHALNTLTDTTGVMITFLAPRLAALPALRNYTPVDALFVAEDGVILQITPGVTLGELREEVLAKDPIKALLFLKAGTAARSIRPQDVVVGPMFAQAQATIK